MSVETPLEWAEVLTKAVLAVFLVIIGLFFVKKGKNQDESAGQKYFLFGVAMLALMSSLTRIFFIVTDFEPSDITLVYTTFWKMATFSSFVALIFIALVLEKYSVKTRYVGTIIATIGAISILFVDINTVRILVIPIYLVIGIEVFLLYLYVAIKSPGDLRMRAIWMILSLFIFILGIFLDSDFMGALFGFDTGIIAAVLMGLGLGWYFKLNY